MPIGTGVYETESDCLQLGCWTNPSCEWYTYDTSSRVCLLFSECPTIDESCTTCLSGENECGMNNAECDVLGQCLAVPVGTNVESNQDDCLQDCKDLDGCEWYTFDTSSGVCLLFADCPNIDESCGTCISGEDDCESSGTTELPESTTTTVMDSTTPPLEGDLAIVVLGGVDHNGEGGLEIIDFINLFFK